MVKKIYNVVLMSTIGNGITTSGETFFYDWSQIPDKPYKVSFTFNTSISNVNASIIPLIYVDLGQSYNTTATSQNSDSIGYKSSFLGCLRFTLAGFSGTNILYADSMTNPPSYLNGRPQINNFTAQILQNDGTFTNYNSPSNYVLTIYLEEY
jgi:hypothetical protein